jgi:hypothetical protein
MSPMKLNLALAFLGFKEVCREIVEFGNFGLCTRVCVYVGRRENEEGIMQKQRSKIQLSVAK